MYLIDSDIIVDILHQKEKGLQILTELNNQKLFISIFNWIEIVHGIKTSNNPLKKQNEFHNFINDLKIEIITLDFKIAESFLI